LPSKAQTNGEASTLPPKTIASSPAPEKPFDVDAALTQSLTAYEGGTERFMVQIHVETHVGL
jgi:hypothetical protein